ncbi:hypothetical protein [Chromobacterium violaceum]|uniref:capsular polysaccharide export protein, LipB/KpsS family n=1 Tax=Chromobacterium violaceum TaxID=536 RepID=UPI001B3272A9|nr:hypothetical protein [Chromobacterium violaceum]MBP4044691.1 hypothetical protein [Chromobacterium violaceum]
MKKLPRGPLLALGFSWRKQELLKKFCARRDIKFIWSTRLIKPNSTLILWGNTSVPTDLPENVNIIRVEDGFLRSVGLGADLIQPISWVIDGSGIYFDASRPSDLEILLANMEFNAEILRRAKEIRTSIVKSGLSKYNLTSSEWSPPAINKKKVLVIGQVETDASILAGTVDINTNLSLLRTVRLSHPEAWIIYKPHPDVVAGLRKAGKNEIQAQNFCDDFLPNVSINKLLDSVDEVHVMTSLAGFEALLRKKKVVCYGQPFYAGWGLTHDTHSIPRRKRKLELDQLVAATLIEYPLYMSRVTGAHCEVEQAIEELLCWRKHSGSNLPLWRKMLRPFIRKK